MRGSGIAWLGLSLLLPVQAEQTLKVGWLDAAPYSYLEAGQPVGIMLDLLGAFDAWNDDLRLELGPPLGSLVRLDRELQARRYQLTILPRQHALALGMQVLDPAVLRFRVRVLSRVGEPLQIRTLDELARASRHGGVLVMPGSTDETRLRLVPGMQIDAAPARPENLIRKLLLGRGRFVVINEMLARYVAREDDLARQLRWQPLTVAELELHLSLVPSLPAAERIRLQEAWRKFTARPEYAALLNHPRYLGSSIAETPP